MTNFTELNAKELSNTNGGFVITGAMIVLGLEAIGAGVATGYAAGKIIKHFS